MGTVCGTFTDTNTSSERGQKLLAVFKIAAFHYLRLEQCLWLRCTDKKHVWHRCWFCGCGRHMWGKKEENAKNKSFDFCFFFLQHDIRTLCENICCPVIPIIRAKNIICTKNHTAVCKGLYCCKKVLKRADIISRTPRNSCVSEDKLSFSRVVV